MANILVRYRIYLFIVLGVLVALGVWWGLSSSSPEKILTTEAVSDTSPADKTLIDTLLQLRAVTLSGTIFTDPTFMSLRDFGTQIIPEPIGRENPFAAPPLAQSPEIPAKTPAKIPPKH